MASLMSHGNPYSENIGYSFSSSTQSTEAAGTKQHAFYP
jgi:hypothetical protein